MHAHRHPTTNSRSAMKLQYKFMLIIGLVLALSYAAILFAIARLQHDLIIGQASQQARMLFHHIILIREWVSDHQGLFFIKTDQVVENPYLDPPHLQTQQGIVLVKRNPAMVTRELSDYTARAGYGSFRVTSLKPINPTNRPDSFEERSLHNFSKNNLTEYSEISSTDKGKVLRYIAPLHITANCLGCHAEHGYQVGDIRGALSITIPINWADQVIANNNRTMLIYGAVTIIAVCGVVFLLFHLLVHGRLTRLGQAIAQYPESVSMHQLPGGKDEIGRLAEGFASLHHRLEKSRQDLHAAAEQAFYNEKMAALGQITAGIAHEINNPLGGLRNCVKNMKDAPDDLNLHSRYLPLLDKGLQRIEQTMRQLLNFGRNNPLSPRQVDIDEEIRECFVLLSYKMKNIQFSLSLNIGGKYCMDTEAIKQIVVNIGLNAIQAMPEGGQLRVQSWREDDRLHLAVTDSGSGIEPQIIDQIFDPFFTTKQVGEGTGLGLAVTYTLVHKMGGTITVTSQPGQGSTFLVILPIDNDCASFSEPRQPANQAEENKSR